MAKRNAGKFYVVWQGRIPGIYREWLKAKMQIEGFPNAKYRAYASLAEAQVAFSQPFQVNLDLKPKTSWRNSDTPPLLPSICVDAACNMKTGTMEYRGVNTVDGSVIFAKGPFFDTTNNVGEFLAIVHALALLNKDGDTGLMHTPIYSYWKNPILKWETRTWGEIPADFGRK